MKQQNFLGWFLDAGIAEILTSAQHNIASTWRYLNILGLLKTLFAPYRRLQVEKVAPQYGVSGLFDKIVFNTISRLIGAFVRLTLIITGIISLILIIITIAITTAVLILLPPLMLPKYLRLKASIIFENDLKSNEVFPSKIKNSHLTNLVSQFFDEDLKSLLENISAPEALKIKADSTIKDILISLPTTWPDFADYLAKKSISAKSFENLITTVDHFLETGPKRPLTPIGQTLSFGYTRTLERFARYLTGQNIYLTPSEQQALEEIEKILTRQENNNVLLVGEPGVGRHSVIENLAVAITTSHLPNLSAKQLIYLDTIALAGTGKNLVAVKSNFESVLLEAKNAGNVILVIDQIDKITTSLDTRLDLSEVLIFALRENALPIIGITTPDEFNACLRPNAQILKFFEKIDLEEPKNEETLQILIGDAINSLKKNHIASNLEALVEIIARSNQLITDKKQPEKSIILFDEALGQARDLNQKVTLGLVDTIISYKTKTPVGVLTQSEAKKLKNLEEILHKRIIGQDEAIAQLARAMRRARTEIENTQKPIGSFLFLGPTGVGKTETAKALAEAYFSNTSEKNMSDSEFFGDETKMVRLDMSEFQASDGLARLIGDISSKTPGILASQIRDHPFGILLLDEFEKANPAVHNLFLQVLDEGFLTDAFGKKVSFSNIIIIATSNAGAEFIRELVTKGETDLSQKLVDYILEKGLFSPELINRFDGTVVYHPLTQEEIVEVTSLILKNLSLKLKESKNITLEITDELSSKVASAGYNPQFGARSIKRLIQDKIEDEIAKMIIDEKVKNGDKIKSSDLISLV